MSRSRNGDQISTEDTKATSRAHDPHQGLVTNSQDPVTLREEEEEESEWFLQLQRLRDCFAYRTESQIMDHYVLSVEQ